MSAAWAQHRVIQAYRQWLRDSGQPSSNDFIKRRRLSPNTWKAVVRGATWMTFEQTATLVALIGAPIIESLADVEQALALAVPGPGERRRAVRDARYSRRPPSVELFKAGFASSDDLLWFAVTQMAEEADVEPPKSMVLVDSEFFDAIGDPDGRLIVMAPRSAWDDIRLVGDRVQLGQSGGVPVFLDLAVRDDDWEFCSTAK